MTGPRVPRPAPRPVRKLPWVVIIIGSVLGGALMLFLWNVAIGLQVKNTPRHGPLQWEQPR